MNRASIVIGVGATADQELSFQVLKYSIESQSSVNIDTVRLDKISSAVADCVKIKQNTPFSFQRFSLAYYLLENDYDVGIYLDSDMLVLADISELAKYADIDSSYIGCVSVEKSWARREQTSVIVFNRDGAKSLITHFEKYLAEEIDYSSLMYLRGLRYARAIPSYWNSLEYLSYETKLIHWTDVDTQPWLQRGNPNAGVWYATFYQLFGSSDDQTIVNREIDEGNVLPSLSEILTRGPSITQFSYASKIKDLFFIPPPRIKKIKVLWLRKLLGPLFNIYRFIHSVVKSGQINVR